MVQLTPGGRYRLLGEPLDYINCGQATIAPFKFGPSGTSKHLVKLEECHSDSEKQLKRVLQKVRQYFCIFDWNSRDKELLFASQMDQRKCR